MRQKVCSVLDSLEREYKREDVDWYAKTTAALNYNDQDQENGTPAASDRVTLIAQLIAKHQEQKEAFLKACTLARRTAETFLKYSNRSLQYFSHPASQSTFRGPDGKVKGKTILLCDITFVYETMFDNNLDFTIYLFFLL